MVLSRPCVTAHKPCIVLAEIHVYPTDLPKDADTFRAAAAFFTNIRDGDDAPDRFYLGSVPGYTGRFCAALDRIFTVEIKSPAELVSRRIAALDSEFSRDLHLRIFRSFASLGFDDVRWYSTDDLRLLLQFGESELAGLSQVEKQQELQQGKQQFRDKPFPEKGLTKASNARAQLEATLQPYREELARRDEENSS